MILYQPKRDLNDNQSQMNNIREYYSKYSFGSIGKETSVKDFNEKTTCKTKHR